MRFLAIFEQICQKAILHAMQGISNRREIKVVWGFGIYLMHLSDYLAGRKHKKKVRTCDVCGQRFRMIEEMEVHRRKEHPDAHPRKEESPEA